MKCAVRKGEQVQTLAIAAAMGFNAVRPRFNNAGVGSGGQIWKNA